MYMTSEHACRHRYGLSVEVEAAARLGNALSLSHQTSSAGSFMTPIQ